MGSQKPRAAGDDSPGNDATRVTALLAELSPSTDLPSLVERVSRSDLSRIVIPAATLAAWKRRDPSGLAKVLTWLETKGVTIAAT